MEIGGEIRKEKVKSKVTAKKKRKYERILEKNGKKKGVGGNYQGFGGWCRVRLMRKRGLKD